MRHEVQGQTADISDGWPDWTMLGKELRVLELQGSLVQVMPMQGDSAVNYTAKSELCQFLIRILSQNAYTPPLDCSPTLQHLLENIHICMVITKLWLLRVFWYIQFNAHCSIFFIAEFLKQSVHSLMLL